MKKFILSVAIIAATLSSKAQDGGTVKFGAKAGLNLSSLSIKSGGEKDNSDTKPGFYVGGLAEINLAESFAIQPEVLFNYLGGKEGDSKVNLSYVSVPVLLKYKVSGVGIYLGPQIGFLLSAKAKEDDESIDIKDELKSTDFSGVVGVDYTLPSGFGFGARYQLGLSNIAEGGNSDNSIKNKSIQIGVHYLFGGK